MRKKILEFFNDIFYVARCLFEKNPNHPDSPRLWDLKPGMKLSVHLAGFPSDVYLIKRVFLVFRGYDGRPHFKFDAQTSSGREEKAYLADQGIVPYQDGGWNETRTSYLES